MEIKNQFISILISTQLLTQKQSLWKDRNPDCEELNENIKIEKKNVVQNTGNLKTYIVPPSSGTTKNTIQCKNTQNKEKKTNAKNETTNTIKLHPSNNTKCELVSEDTSNTKSNTSIHQKEHKKFAFIIGDSMVKDIDGCLLTGCIKRKFIVKVRPFLSA